MSIESINNSIDNKIVETNDRTNRSIEIRHNLKDKKLQKELETFDNTYLSDDEREQISALNEAEKAQLKDSNKYAVKSAVGCAKAAVGGLIGKSTGILSAADNSQQYVKSEDKLDGISNTRDNIRAKARERYNEAINLTAGNKTETEDFDYGKRF